MALDKDTGTKTLSQRLHDQLFEIIMAAKPGIRLPSEPKLAKQLGVSRATLREAMRTFETQGLIHRRQGVGTFVVHPSRVIETGLEVLESIFTQADRIDLTVQSGPFHVLTRVATPEEAKKFGMHNGDEVVQVSWVIETENRPIAYLVDVLPTTVLTSEEVRQKFSGSVLDMLLEKEALSLTTSRTEISATPAPPEVARALGIQRGDVLLFFEATLYTADGSVVDYSYSYYLPGYFKFHVVRRVG